MNKHKKMTKLKKEAQFCAELLDKCGSQDEFRLRCVAMNKDPEKVFEPYSEYINYMRGYNALGISTRFTLKDWWAFEKYGTCKPDPYGRGYVDHLKPSS
jgi:hypothetical protein